MAEMSLRGFTETTETGIVIKEFVALNRRKVNTTDLDATAFTLILGIFYIALIHVKKFARSSDDEGSDGDRTQMGS